MPKRWKNSECLEFIRGLLALVSVILAGGCALPRSTTSLGTVLEKEIRRGNDAFSRYRCTAGAHRGASNQYTENTLAALQAADNDPKYAFIEFDVQYAKDGRIVVFHDKRLLRLFGSIKRVGSSTFEELEAVSHGEIAAYDEVMAALKRKKIDIEIKSRGDLAEDMRLVDQIVADLKRRGRLRDVLISSISADVIRYITRTYPRIPTGQVFWLTSSTYLHFDRLTERLFREAAETDADYLLLHVANLRNIESLLRLKPRGKTIVFWDFDDAIYVVHRDLADRLWGRSRVRNFFEALRYRLYAPFLRRQHDQVTRLGISVCPVEIQKT